MTKRVPFSVNRNDSQTLVAQVSDGLRQAIVSGFYKVGDVLPSSYELVKMLGVSRIVTRAALSKLDSEGYVMARSRIGSVVRDRAAKQWRGHVVFVGELIGVKRAGMETFAKLIAKGRLPHGTVCLCQNDKRRKTK